MLKAKDFRREAWTKLNGRWGVMVLVALICDLIAGACGGLSVIGIGAIALMLIQGPLTLGVAMLSMRVIRSQDVKVDGVFDGFKNFLNAFVLALINSILIMLWSLLFIIPGIIKSYSYSMSYYILADHPEMTANEARKESMRMMHGNKWRLFCLDFSFIGWYLLCILTFGILSFWVTPYHNVAYAAFYQSLLPEETTAADVEEPFDTVKEVADKVDGEQ